jgi:hypothetical protein
MTAAVRSRYYDGTVLVNSALDIIKSMADSRALTRPNVKRGKSAGRR